MFFDKFSSLYEIFAASNLASIVSDNFNKAIEEKVLINYATSREKNLNINSKVNIAQETAQSIINNPNKNAINQKNLNTVLGNLGTLKEEYEIIDNKVQKTNFTESIKFIPLLSFFGTLYSLSALITLGSCDSIGHSYIFWNSIGFINILSVIFILYIANKGNLKLSFPRLALDFILILFLGLLFYFFIPESFFVIKTGNEKLSHIIVIESIFIPIFHYLLFVVIGTYKAKNGNKDILEELSAFETRFDALLIELDSTSDFVNKIKDYLDFKNINVPKNVSVPKNKTVSKKVPRKKG